MHASEKSVPLSQLPWSLGKSEKLFTAVLVALLMVLLIIGLVIPMIDLPEVQREKLEKLPPQLAKVIQRKKEAPKLKPKPVVEPPKKQPEKKVEPKKIEPIKPKTIAKPEPKPKPKGVVKKEITPEKRKVARKRAQKRVEQFSSELSDMRNLLSDDLLNTNSANLSNEGSAETDVGTVVNNKAVENVAGVDESQLTRETGASALKEVTRDTTKVKSLPKEAMAKAPDKNTDTVAGLTRTRTQIRRVFEQNQSRFDRIYRRALRSNPALEGTITLRITAAATGEVTGCDINSSEIQDSGMLKRVKMTCSKLVFSEAGKQDVFEYPLSFSP